MTTHHRSNVLHLLAFMALSAGFFGFLASNTTSSVVAPHAAAATLTISHP